MSHFSSDRIYLIGYMASGKTTIGRLMAKKLGYDFIDTDSAIEKLNGLSIKEIFQTKGEPWFRQEESRILKFTTELDKTVISVGGGMPVFNNNLAQMLASGLTIYLKLSAKALAARIAADPNTRPLHIEDSAIAIEKAVAEKLDQRKRFYQEAHLTISGTGLPESITDALHSKIQGDY